MIRCAHCKNRHQFVADVRHCADMEAHWREVEEQEAADAEARWERAIEEREYHLAYAHLDYDGPDVW